MLVNIVATVSLVALCGAVHHAQSLNKDPVQPRYTPEDSATVTQKKAEETEKESRSPGAQILDNPSYDPNLYNSFIPQDTVQQYVSNYGGPFTPAAYVPAFAVQQGYEGYLVPDDQTGEDNYPSIYKYVSELLPRSVVAWMMRSAAVILTTIGVVFFGGAITSLICNFTQLCSISFASVPFFNWRPTAETISRALENELTAERIGRTAQLVKAAIEKFSQMQQEETQNSLEPVKED